MNKAKLFGLVLLIGFSSGPLSSLENTLSPHTAAIKDPANLLNDEIRHIEQLIQATQQSLEGQKKLRELVIEYQKIQNLYLQDTHNNELLFQLIKSAYRTLSCVKENHLMQTLDTEFISELTKLAQIAANKRGIPKP